ncbi:peptidoglycan DD-metalloendopeptidase family protein [Tychonema sp. LEGE 07199]|nr:peptidoglycan DD-metalloendopeptidase family protein [Tychonema sp. LEGE 07199]MBE9135114.1 peptidoglycan DD-metalloendopeptidase family protein [Tychonema sp. LEGE 07196]
MKILGSVTGATYQPGNRNDWYEVEVNGKRGFVAAYYVDQGSNSGGGNSDGGNSGGPITTEAQFIQRLYGHGSGVVTQRPNSKHWAIDSVSQGTYPYKVYALAGGTITSVRKDQYGGLYVDVWNDQLKRTFRYLHFQDFAPGLKVGQNINAGHYLGIEGYSGYTIPKGPAGRHTHFAIVANGVEQDPWPTLRQIP